MIGLRRIFEHDRFGNARLCAKFQRDIFKTGHARQKTNLMKKPRWDFAQIGKMIAKNGPRDHQDAKKKSIDQ